MLATHLLHLQILHRSLSFPTANYCSQGKSRQFPTKRKTQHTDMASSPFSGTPSNAYLREKTTSSTSPEAGVIRMASVSANACSLSFQASLLKPRSIQGAVSRWCVKLPSAGSARIRFPPLTSRRFSISCALALPPESELTPATKFSALGADSLDTVEIVMGLEEEFGISVEEESSENITTVQEAADLIEKLVQKKAGA
ncbi:unnamed protein product [Thlaspi arvense]|uniref:Acyl carrier protein n=1 Tax=Thlaspi arvense TaxID=13288 RepID=A0AAU9RIV6_THLAR|nr:unnamed protein product [Thlaspi arvense]